jgi:hypothetical protein
VQHFLQALVAEHSAHQQTWRYVGRLYYWCACHTRCRAHASTHTLTAVGSLRVLERTLKSEQARLGTVCGAQQGRGQTSVDPHAVT